MFKKNTAVTGFTFGLVSSTDGTAVTAGTTTGYYTLDGGTQGTITDTPVHEGNGQWSVNLTAAEMNGDIVGLLFVNSSAINASFTIKTDTSIVSDTVANNLYQFTTLSHQIEGQRGHHSFQAQQGTAFYVDPVNGDTHANGNRGGVSDPYNSIQDCHDNAVTDSQHDVIFLVSGNGAGATTLTEAVTLSKRYLQIRGPGRNFKVTRSTVGDTITITADGIALEGFQVNTAVTGSGRGVAVSGADFVKLKDMWINDTRGDGVSFSNCQNFIVEKSHFTDTGQSGSGNGVNVTATAGQNSSYGFIRDNTFESVQGDAVILDPTGGGTLISTRVVENKILNSTGAAVRISAGSADTIVSDNRLSNNTSGIVNNGTASTVIFNDDYTPAEIRTEIDSNSTQLAAIVADTNELQTDWADGGRLDLILDARSSQTSVDTIDANVDAILLDTGTDGVVISATTANQIADAILNRDFSAISDTNARTLLNAARFLRNKYSVSGTTLTVTKEDDSTSAWTATLTTDATADPVTGSDPA